MSDLDREAQLEYILDHYQNPRNHGAMTDADVRLEGGHPGCSDVVTMYLKVNDDHVEKISFEGEGCTISQAAASIVTEHMIGKNLREIENLDYQILIEEIGDELVKTRPRCATLGLDTVKASVQEYRRQQAR